MATTLETIRLLTVRGRTEGLDRVQSELTGVSRAQLDVARASAEAATATDTSARRQASVANQFARLTSEMQGSSKAARDYANTIKLIADAERQGLASAQAAAAARTYAQTQLQSAAFKGPAVDQSGLNSLLGMKNAVSGAARASADVFAAELDRMDRIAEQKARQIGQTFADNLNRSFGIGSSASSSGATFSALEDQMKRLDEIERARAAHTAATSQQDLSDRFGFDRGAGAARASAAVFEEAAREAEAFERKVSELRAVLDPLSAAQAKLNAEVAEYGALRQRGLITEQENAAAVARSTTVYERAVQEQKKAARAERFGIDANQARNLGYQIGDVISSAPYATPQMIALQQGPQILDALTQNGKGAGENLKNIWEGAKASAASFAAFMGPGGLILTGLTAVAGAALYFTDNTEKNFKKLEDAATSYGKVLQELGRGHENLAKGMSAVFDQNAAFSPEGARARQAAVLEDQRRALQAARDQAPRTALDNTLSIFRPDRTAYDLGRRFAGEISAKNIVDLAQNFEAGKTSAAGFRTEIDKLASDASLPEYLRTAVAELRKLADGAVDAEAAAAALQKGLDRYRSDAARTRYDTARDDLNAFVPDPKTDREKIERAYQSEIGRIQQLRGINGDGREELEADALRRRSVALAEVGRQEQIIRDGHKLDLADIGARSAAQQRELAVLRERNALAGNMTMDPAEKKKREQEAGEVAYARALYASNEALRQRSVSMQSVLDDLGNEMSAVGQTIEATTRLQTAYRLMQQAKEAAYSEGRDVSQEEIAAINATAEAAGRATARLQAMQAEQDLLFERSQLFRSTIEQQVAQATRGYAAGSAEANRIADLVRGNAKLRELKEDVSGLFDGLGSNLLQSRSFDDVLSAIGDRLQNFAGKQLDRVFENIGNSIFNSLAQTPEQAQLQSMGMPTVSKELLGTSALNAMWVRSADPLAMTGAAGGAGGALGAIANNFSLGSGKTANTAGAPDDVVAYIRQAASSRGIDPETALRVIKQESGFNINAKNLSSREQSYGLMQLNTQGGLGVTALQRGINVRDPSTWRQQVDFGLDTVAKDGWRQWYGARDVGISRWEGIGKGSGALSSKTLADTSTKLEQDASQFQNDFAQITGSINQGVGQIADQFVPGFGGILTNILNGMSSQSGGGGFLGSLFGGIFGGGGTISAGTTKAILGGAAGLFDGGGYTGPGGVHQVAGLVHRGEVVFSQADVSRHGGVGAVEAMRLGMRGYAGGGVVGDFTPRMAAPMIAANSNAPSSSSTHVTVGVAVDDEGNLKAYVKSIAESEGRNASAKAVAAYDRDHLAKRVKQVTDNPRKYG